MASRVVVAAVVVVVVVVVITVPRSSRRSPSCYPQAQLPTYAQRTGRCLKAQAVKILTKTVECVSCCRRTTTQFTRLPARRRRGEKRCTTTASARPCRPSCGASPKALSLPSGEGSVGLGAVKRYHMNDFHTMCEVESSARSVDDLATHRGAHYTRQHRAGGNATEWCGISWVGGA